MSDMEIPVEAYQAARTALWGRPAGDATLVAQMAVEAAAPFIARAAQVTILRQLADEDHRRYTRLICRGDQYDAITKAERKAAWDSMLRHREKANDLERREREK